MRKKCRRSAREVRERIERWDEVRGAQGSGSKRWVVGGGMDHWIHGGEQGAATECGSDNTGADSDQPGQSLSGDGRP